MGKVDQVREEVRSLLHAQGMRATAARIAVLTVLHERQSPLTHEQVMSHLGAGAYDRASIWRVLSDLAGCNILRRMDLGDRVWRYELLDACRAVSDDHPHFLCEACGEVLCLPPLEVRSQAGTLPDILLHAEFRVRVTGKCAECVVA